MKYYLLILVSSVALSAQNKEPVSDYSPTYKVEEGDTLSEIAQKKLGGDIYAPGGGLEQLIALNPTLKDRQIIYPGQQLKLVDPAIKLPKDLSVTLKNSKKQN